MENLIDFVNDEGGNSAEVLRKSTPVASLVWKKREEKDSNEDQGDESSLQNSMEDLILYLSGLHESQRILGEELETLIEFVDE